MLARTSGDIVIRCEKVAVLGIQKDIEPLRGFLDLGVAVESHDASQSWDRVRINGIDKPRDPFFGGMSGRKPGHISAFGAVTKRVIPDLAQLQTDCAAAR